jgi:hypothetical protein
MRHEAYDFVVPTSVSASPALRVDCLTNILVTLSPGALVGTTASSTLQLQGRHKAGGRTCNIGDPATGTTGDVNVLVEGAWYDLWVDVTSYTQGTPAATISGHNHRTE